MSGKMLRPISLLIATTLLVFLLPCTLGARLRMRATRPPTTTGRARLVLGKKAPPRAPTHGNANSRGTSFAYWTPPPDNGGGSNGALCQIWNQDCPDGYKCIPEDLDSIPRCRIVVDNPDQVGDSCDSLDDNDGDSCDIDGMCIDGECRPLCQGSAASPVCPSYSETCHIYEAGATICEEECDPMLNGVCGGGEYCSIDALASPNLNKRFSCMIKPDEPLKLEGGSCVYTSQCQQGYACMPKTSLRNGFCDDNSALSCCTRLAEDEDDCHPQDQLVPYYSDAPPGYEHIGVCVFVIF